MPDSRRDVVETGYDRLAGRYREWAAGIRDDPRDETVERFAEMLPAGATVLDIGCGDGMPTTARLAERFEVTGVDVSAGQVEAARGNVPRATFVHADVRQLSLPAASLAGVVALYSISHIPRAEHAALFGRIFGWLAPRGVFLASLGAKDAADWTGDWLGVSMFFSSWSADRNRQLLRTVGFELVIDSVREVREPEGSVSFLWVIARRPPTGSARTRPNG